MPMSALPAGDEHATRSAKTAGDSVVDRFRKSARVYAECIAVSDGKRRLTYEELDRLSDTVSAGLSGRVAARPVLLLLDHSPEMIVSILAVLKAGGIYVGVTPAHVSGERLARLVDALHPTTVMARGENLRHTLAAAPDVSIVDFDEMKTSAAPPADYRPQPSSPSAPAVIFHTSGSTGTPKGVVRSHRAIAHRVDVFTDECGLCADDRIALLSHCGFAASEGDLFGALLNGAAVCLYDLTRGGVEGLSDWLNGQSVTVLHPPVFVMRRFLAQQDSGTCFGSVRILALAGEAVTAADVRAAFAVLPQGARVLYRYSSSEAGLVARRFFTQPPADDGGPLSVGEAAPDKRIRLLDDDGNEAAAGAIGEIEVTSRFLADGYWGDPTLTRRAFTAVGNGLVCYRTGDLGRWHGAGGLELVGRRDAVAKIQGQQVNLREIEAALIRVPGINAAVVLSRENETRESELIAFLRGEAVDAGRARAQLAARLDPWAVPKRYFSVTEWPTTATGKLDRAALLSRVPVGGALLSAAEQTNADAWMRTCWSQLLGHADFGADDSFFLVGGDSLLAARLSHEIGLRFGVRLDLRSFARHATLNELVEQIETAQPIADPRIVAIGDPSADRVLFFVPGGAGALAQVEYVYRPLLEELGPDLRIVALLPQARRRGSAGEIADDLLRITRSVQPHGPYTIIGECLGGIVAFEMACRLQRAGESVERLILMDSRFPSAPALLQMLARRALVRGRQALRHYSTLARRGAVHATRALRPRGEQKRVPDFAQLSSAARSLTGRQRERGRTHGAETRFAAQVYRHRPSRFAGRLALVAPAESLASERHRGWERVASGVDMVVVPGSPRTYLKPPFRDGTRAAVLEVLGGQSSQE